MSWLGRALTALRQVRCSHSCYLEDMTDTRQNWHDEFGLRISGEVSCPCQHCGKVLRGPYGLALDCTWASRDQDTVPVARRS